jgi:ribosomal protein L18
LVHSGDCVAAGSYIAYFSEQYNNQPANGETITIAATGDCSIVSSTSLTVGNNIAANAYAVGIEIASVAATAGADTVSVSIANPGSQTETQTFTCVP